MRKSGFQLNANGRDFAVGDIHGHFGRLEVALAAVSSRQKRTDCSPEGILWTEALNRSMY